MTGSLFIETTSEINLYNTISVPSSRYAVLRLKSGDNYWDVTTKGTDGLLLQKQGASDVQLKLDTSGNVSIPGISNLPQLQVLHLYKYLLLLYVPI